MEGERNQLISNQPVSDLRNLQNHVRAAGVTARFIQSPTTPAGDAQAAGALGSCGGHSVLGPVEQMTLLT